MSQLDAMVTVTLIAITKVRERGLLHQILNMILMRQEEPT